MNINVTDFALLLLAYTGLSTVLMAAIFYLLGASSYRAVWLNILICIIFFWYQPFHMLKHCWRQWQQRPVSG